MYTIYTDGACHGNPGPGAWVCLFFDEHRLLKVCGGYVPATTNNQMELRAALEGLKLLPPSKPAMIYTDSQYLQNGITKWIAQWKSKQWKTANKKPVKNRELWEDLDRLNHPKIKWHYVAAHQGIIYNEICDQLAQLLIAQAGKIENLQQEFEQLFWKMQRKSAGRTT